MKQSNSTCVCSNLFLQCKLVKYCFVKTKDIVLFYGDKWLGNNPSRLVTDSVDLLLLFVKIMSETSIVWCQTNEIDKLNATCSCK